MIIFFIVGLLLGGVAVIFALQNVAMVSIVFFNWQIDGSLSVVLALSVLAGIFIALFLTLPEFFSSYFAVRRLEKRIKFLDEELRKQKELTVFAHKTSPNNETISHIEQGAIQQ